MLVEVAVLAYDDARHQPVGVLHGNAAPLQMNRDRALLSVFGERLPHLAGPEAGIVELFDQRGHVVASEAENRHDRPAQREVLDPLRCPERTDLRPGNTPHLLGVGAEERIVQPASESRGHPFLERLRVVVPMSCRPEIRERAAHRLPQAQPCDDILRRDRIVEVLAVVVDAREPRPLEELVAEHLLPETLNGLELGEETVAAEIEAIAVELDRLCDPTNRSIGLEDGAGPPTTTEYVCGSQASGPSSQNRRTDRLAVQRPRRGARGSFRASDRVDPRVQLRVEQGGDALADGDRDASLCE